MVYTLEELTARVAPIARKHGIRRVFLFGSYSRGEATEESDVDLLIDKEGVRAKGLQWGGIYEDFAEALEKEVDMLTTHIFERLSKQPSAEQLTEKVRQEMRLLYAEQG